MSCCTLFNRALFTEASLTGVSVEIDMSILTRLIPVFNSGTSGIWRPIIVNRTISNHNYVDLLTQPKSALLEVFDPFNCSSSEITDYSDLEQPIFGLDCSYCNPLEPTYTICCTGSGSCDNRMLKDDYLSKIPLLNQKYLTEFYDWKYFEQFPSVSNKPLGFEHFIKLSSLKNFNITSDVPEEAKMMIDWSLKERMGEIPYDKETSQYDNIDDHNKAYNKFLQVGKTCGNFILTQIEPTSSGYNPYYPIFDGLIGGTGVGIPWPNWKDALPTPDEFSVLPYGFDNKTYDNIFVKHEKIGSHWKWNYSSGILGWYRYFQTGIINDPRPISGVDLYIPPGDVFYATNDGPEYAPYNGSRDGDIKFCPSGLKLIQNNGVVGVIPSGSKFTYISNNLYDRFYSIYTALDYINEEDHASNSNINILSPTQIFELSALLCTSPEYDQITIDLFKRNANQIYELNQYKQLSGFNKDMSTSSIGSISRLDYIKTTGDLITTLANKYGAYVWFPPQSTTTLELTKEMNAACYMDLDFDMSVKLSDTYRLSSPSLKGMKDCFEPSFRKNFDFAQSLELANLKIETKVDTRTRYAQTGCAGTSPLEISKAAKMAGVYFNDNLIKEMVYTTGLEHFYAKYPKAELDRKYGATAINPRIDKAAFHHQGGVYYDSKIFGADNSTIFIDGISLELDDGSRAKIKFTTKDVGIKLYSLKIEKLRGSTEDTYECRAFPNQNSCNCFRLQTFEEYPYICNQTSLVFSNDPLRYTPGLSTTFSPRLKSYGGYSSHYITGILGNDRIPNHPDTGVLLDTVDKKIDPESPYGCEKSVQLSLPNYVYSSWAFSLPGYNTIHADIWAQVLENVDLFRTTLYWENPDNEDGGFDSIPNPGYQRFASKVDINGTAVYDKQKKIVIEKGNTASSITANITNPYLLAILGGSEHVLYPPNGNSCLPSNIIGGDENILVPIRFTRIPRKQIINFAIPSTTGMGTLQRGFFHPNSGLTYKTNLFINEERTINNSPIEYLKQAPFISYDKELFDSEAPYNSGSILIGSFTDEVKKILSQINGFGSHRKARLYLKLEERWYEYNTDDTFGFKKGNDTYIGEPYLFKYSSQDSNEIVDGPIIPVSPKGHIPFNYAYNYVPTGSKVTHYCKKEYPFIHSNFTKEEQIRLAKLDGVRMYFLLGENDTALISLVDKISNLPTDEQDKITVISPEVVLTNGERWRYKGNGAKNVASSYVFADYNRLYTNFSDLHIDYEKRNRKGYVFGSKKPCNQTVQIYNINNPKQSYDAKIIEKSIYCLTVDKNNQKIKKTNDLANEYRKIYTQITFDKDIRYDESYIDFSLLRKDSSNLEGADSFVIYQRQPQLSHELDNLLLNGNYSTKWSDIFSFDGKLTNDLSQYFHSLNYLDTAYPSSLYDNNFFKIIINNTDYKTHRYNINLHDNNFFITHSGLVNYTIHQTYNIGLDILTNGSVTDYQNYLPFMDINIPQSGDNVTNDFRDKIQPDLQQIIEDQKIPSGTIKISGILTNLGSTHTYENDFISPTANLFWVNLKKGKLLESALTINNNKTFYSNTLRVDSSPFQLKEINSTRTVNTDGCYRVFSPSIPTATQTFSNNILNFDHFKQVPYTGAIFSRFPVYCDTDNLPEGSCSSLACGINTAGYISYSGIYDIQTNKTRELADGDNNIPYIISYDGGFYNPIGNKSLNYIQRIELSPNNPLYAASNCDMGISPRPILNRISVLNEEYQQLMNDSIVDDHTSVVQKTDKLANEMFFRLVYGEKQKINLNTIDNVNNSISFKDLIKYTYPKTEAKDVYKNIPYDLDTTADISNRKISGSLSIRGILRVGDSISAEVGGKTVDLSIVRENGKILTMATVDGKSTSGVIYTESSTTNNLIVSNQRLPYYTFLKKCEELEPRNLGFFHAFTYGDAKEKDCEGNSLTYPWWPVIDRAAWLEIRKIEVDAQNARNAGNNDLADLLSKSAYDRYTPYLCPIPTDYVTALRFSPCNPEFLDSQGRRIPYGPVLYAGGCAWTSGPAGGWGCTNYGVGPGIDDALDTSIYTILSSKSTKIKLGGVARGVFGLVRECFVVGGSINLTRSGSGDIEDKIGGGVVANPRAIPSKITTSGPPCGSCKTLDYKDPLTGYDYYDPIKKRSVPPSAGDLEDNCECADWDYGYCRNSDNARCLCSTESYDYDEFDYSFEYCRYNISLKAHKRKVKYTPNGISVSKAKACESMTPGISVGGSPSAQGEVQEEFSFLESSAGAPAVWYIHNAETVSNYPTYAAVCPEDLCSIEYDNNTLTIILPNGPNLCINNTIRSNCPLINVTVPNNTYTVSDASTSSCDNCDVEPNKITMVDQKQNWEIVTETRTCILGYILSDGNPNENGPIEMGCQTIGCGYCNGCCTDQCCNDDYTNCGMGLALKQAPESFPWSVCITFTEPVKCVGGNHRYPYGTVGGCDIPIVYPLITSNNAANRRYVDIWKAQMKQLRLNTAPCFNNRTTVDVNDIVEGVVPGSCGQVTFTPIVYNGMKYRATLGDPAIGDNPVTFTVASYTYQYRRPRTIQDIFKGETLAAQCSAVVGSCPPTSTINMSERFKTVDCDTVPRCYNNEVPKCDTDNYCCGAGKNSIS